MNYYPFNVGDYSAATAHLRPLEDCFYRRMLDRYYQTEKPLAGDFEKLCRILRAVTRHDKAAVLAVSSEFFILTSRGYEQKRCDEEISKFKDSNAVSRENGRKGGRPPKNLDKSIDVETRRVSVENPELTQEEPSSKGNQETEPRTKNQEPLEAAPQAAEKAKRLPPDWVMPHEYHVEALRIAAEKKRPGVDIQGESDKFRDYWHAKSGKDATKLDWLATWRNWIRTACERHGGNGSGKTSGVHIGKQDYSTGWGPGK